MSLPKGADKYDDQVTVVMTILGNSEEIKNFLGFQLELQKAKLTVDCKKITTARTHLQ